MTSAAAADPVTVSVETFRPKSSWGYAAVTRVENLTDQTYPIVFIRCHFFSNGRAVVSQLGYVSNLRPRRVTFTTVTATERFPNPSVSCEFERIGS